MKIFLLIGMFSLCFIKESGAVPGSSNDCEKTYTSLIALDLSKLNSSQKVTTLNDQLRNAKKLNNQADVAKHTAAIKSIKETQRVLNNNVHSTEIDISCLSGPDFTAKLEAYKNDKPSQERLKVKLQQVLVASKSK